MSSVSSNTLYTSSTTVTLPSNAANIQFTLSGAKGGGGNGGGAGGASASGIFTANSALNFQQTEYTLTIGSPGGAGGSAGGGGGGSGVTSGGNGGTGQFSTTTSFSCPDGRGYCDQRCCTGDCNQACRNCFGGSAYCGGSQGNGDPCCGGSQGTPGECFCCFTPNTCFNTTTTNTGGGGGGGGGTGILADGTLIAFVGGGAGGRGGGGPNGADASEFWSDDTNDISTQVFNGNNGSNQSNGGDGGGGASANGSVSYQTAAENIYRSDYLNLTNSGADLGSPSIRVEYDALTPEIDFFQGSPNPQDSSSGIPQYDSLIQFGLVDWQRAELTSTAFVGTIEYFPGDNLEYEVTNLPQSEAGVNSPTSHSFTLVVYAGDVSVTQNLTVSAFNDNTPIPFATPTTAFDTELGVDKNVDGVEGTDGLEPVRLHTINMGTVQGTDMNTIVSTGFGLDVSNNEVNWNNETIFGPGDTVYFRFVSPNFNTDRTPSGQVNGDGLAVGQFNPVTFSYSYGTLLGQEFTVNTRAPVIQEEFNAEGSTLEFPEPDIDTDPNDSPEFIETGVDIVPNDVEISVEIKADDPDVQARINGGDWVDIREI